MIILASTYNFLRDNNVPNLMFMKIELTERENMFSGIYKRIASPLLMKSASYRSSLSNDYDFTNELIHPIAAAYRVSGRAFLINIKANDARGWFGVPFTDRHPFVQTVTQLMKNKSLVYSETALYSYYKKFQPATAAQRCGIWLTETPLSNFPPYAAVLPWQRQSPSERKVHREQNYHKENEKRGLRIDISEGTGGAGPVSERKGSLEFQALSSLLSSIREKGYIRSNSSDREIGVAVLVNIHNDVKYLIRSGHHRMAVLSALKFQDIPVRIKPQRIIRRSESSYWPNVKNGIYNLKHAEELFDRIFLGIPPFEHT